MVEENKIQAVYRYLLEYYGEQQWWPADDDFEVMVGAILTQNTSWTNVEKAMSQLKSRGLCSATALQYISQQELAPVIRSSGYYNQKAERLKSFANWYLEQGEYTSLNKQETTELRPALLALKGVGNETCDDILLYALHRPVFVIDSYTRRIFSRLGCFEDKLKYGFYQQQFQQSLPADVELYKQYHALIVVHAKQFCRKEPDCEGCPLVDHCQFC